MAVANPVVASQVARRLGRRNQVVGGDGVGRVGHRDLAHLRARPLELGHRLANRREHVRIDALLHEVLPGQPDHEARHVTRESFGVAGYGLG